MALTVGSGFLDDLARRKAQQEVLRQQMAGAAQQAMGGLAIADKAQQQGIANERAATTLRLTEAKQKQDTEQAAAARALQLRLADENAAQRAIENQREERELGLRLTQDERAAQKQNEATRYEEEKRGRDEAMKAAEADLRARYGATPPPGKSMIADDDDATETAAKYGLTAEELRALDVKIQRENEDRALSMQETQAQIDARNRKGLGGASPASKEIADLKRRKLAAETKSAEAKAGGGGGGLTPTMRTKVQAEAVEAQMGLAQSASIRRVISSTPGIEKMVGPIDGNIEKLAGRAGVADQATMKALTTLRTHALMVRKALTGTAGSAQELAQIAEIVPNPGADSVEQIMGKLAAADEYLATKLRVAQSIDTTGSVFTPQGSGESVVPRGRDMTGAAFAGIE